MFFVFILLASTLLTVQIMAFLLNRGEAKYYNFLTMKIGKSLTPANSMRSTVIDKAFEGQVAFIDQFTIYAPAPRSRIYSDGSGNSSAVLFEVYNQSGHIAKIVSLPANQKHRKVKGLLVDSKKRWLYFYGDFGLGRFSIRSKEGTAAAFDPKAWPDRVELIWQNPDQMLDAPFITDLIELDDEKFLIGSLKSESPKLQGAVEKFYKLKCLSVFDFSQYKIEKETCFLPF